MTIKIEEIKNALEKGLNPSKYIYLRIKEDGLDYFCNDFLSKEEETDLLTKGYIYPDLSITIKARGILAEIAIKEPKSVSNKIDNKYEELHKKLQNKLIELTGSKQKTLNKKYSFLCNSQDLASKLSKVIKKYKLNNWNKVESLLLQHIINSYKANWEYVLLIEYYIEKNNSSKLATDYEGFEEKEVEIKKVDTFNI